MAENGLYGSICLSDIPKELITTAANGKKYLNVTIDKRREPSKYGMTHYMKAYCKKEQRQEGVNYFIGVFKQSQAAQQQPAQFQEQAAPVQQAQEKKDDLPF